jgi:lipopolysaccharide export system permease protein
MCFPLYKGIFDTFNYRLASLFMIFKRALRQELNFTTGVVFMVLVTLVLTNLMIRNLANAAGGTINPKDVVVLMGLGIINYLAILLAVSIFIATLIVLNRWYKDSELVVWQTAGISLFQVLKAIFAFTLPLTVVIAILSIVVSPLANEQANIIKQRFQQREDTSLLAPGQFKESTSNDRVFFIEEIDFEKNNLKNIFVSIFGKEKQIIISAKEGFIENDVNGDRYLTLRPGRRYEGIAGELEFRITEFDSYVAKLNPKKTIETTPTNRTLQIWELIQNWTPLNQSELLWRIGIPIMALCFVTIALPLAYTNPRSSRYYSLIFAVLVYFAYSNLLTLLQNWVKNERISFAMAWWPLHLFIFAIGMSLIYFNQNISINLRSQINQLFTKFSKKQ